MNNKAKSIVIHDSFSFKGGGERLVEILCRGLGLDLASGEFSQKSFNLKDFSEKIIDLNVTNSRLIGLRTIRRFWAFRRGTHFLRDYETVVYSGYNAPLAVHNHPSGRNVYYCNTPPRSLYDLNEKYFSTLSKQQVLVHLAYNCLFRPQYESAVKKMNVIVANSENIKRRVKKYLGFNSVVVYPPCDTDKFRWISQEKYFLSLARHDPLKRVDVIIRAFLKMPDRRLVVASSGLETTRLKSLCGDQGNIKFTGDLGDNELAAILGNALATIYIPSHEDFGMSPVESMAAGKPVIGTAEGGLLETIIDGETGVLINGDPSPEDIIHAVEGMTPGFALDMKEACERQANKFKKDEFLRQMAGIINGSY